MKRHLIYKIKTKQVEMISEGKIKYDKSIFAEKEMDLTKKQLDDIYNSERTLLINGKLNLTPRINKREELQIKLDQSSNLDEVKTIIKEMINL